MSEQHLAERRAEKQTKNFFVSYNQHDFRWAEWIAWHLEHNGYSTTLQAWDFTPGANFAIAMDEALRTAERVIAVLSPHYLESQFAAPEWAAAFVADPRGHERKLLPVRVSPVILSGLLSSVVYVDLVSKNEVDAVQDLLAAAGSGRRKPQTAPAFPGSAPPAFPADGPAASVGRSVRLEMILTGTIDKGDKPLIEALEKHLRQLSGDVTLTLMEIRDGSVILTIRTSIQGYRRLETLFREHRISEVLGFPLDRIALIQEEGQPEKLFESEIGFLISILTHPDERSRIAAANSLIEMGEVSVPLLVEAIATGLFSTRAQAVNVLTSMPRQGIVPAVPRLRTLLYDDSTDVRLAAISVLRYLGSRSEPALDRLISLAFPSDQSHGKAVATFESDPRVITSARQALRVMGKPATERLVRIALSDELNTAVIDILYEQQYEPGIEALSEETVALIISRLRKRDSGTLRVIGLVRVLKNLPMQVLAVLQELLQDANAEVRATAIDALGQVMRSESVRHSTDDQSKRDLTRVIRAIVSRIADDDRTVAAAAVATLAFIAQPFDGVIRFLIQLLKKAENNTVRARAAETLGKIGPHAVKAVPALRAALLDSDGAVRQQAAAAIARIDPEPGPYSAQTSPVPHPKPVR